VFFLSVSLGYVAIVAAGLAKLGTGIVNAGKAILTLSPADVVPIAPLATHAVFDAVIADGVVAVLRKARTTFAEVLASVDMIDKLSITAPSLAEQSTNTVHPALAGVLKLVAVDKAAVPPMMAKECNGLSTKSGILFELVLAIEYLVYIDFIGFEKEPTCQDRQEPNQDGYLAFLLGYFFEDHYALSLKQYSFLLIL
tara:strand:+ start:5113 stop:5703 length:591 start_codon:yes stop_codon:yes gene_type:complete